MSSDQLALSASVWKRLGSGTVATGHRRAVRLTTSYERHPYGMAGVPFAVGVWLIILVALLGSIGDRWGAVLVLPAGILFRVRGRVLKSCRT
jgi:hypothetical protein